MGASCRLDIPAIESSLIAVQNDFPRINKTLVTPRDVMTDEVRGNMMAGYVRVDNALANGDDLFELGHSKQLLELNILVLCGHDEKSPDDCASQAALAERQFYEQQGGGIAALMEWLQQHNGDDVWKRAAGAYIHVLSRPQLFFEGNHRTGALIMSYMLAREGKPPFVLSVDNAKAFFDPSTLVKERKRHSLGMMIQMPKLKKRFAKLLKAEANKRFLNRTGIDE